MVKHMVELPTMCVVMIPCTGGSSWQHVNSSNEQCRKRLKEHRRLFSKLWTSFEKLMPHVAKSESSVVPEWSDTCMCWKFRHVAPLCHKYGFKFCNADGCMCGMSSYVGDGLLRKRWRVAYLNCDPAAVFANHGRTCDGTHEHVTCEGLDTDVSGY